MKNSLLFNFTVDKSNNTILVTREFNAASNLVWDAFTKQEMLDQWWAPKPWTSKTKHMQFKVGGRRFYAMCSPEGQEHWSLQEYIEINDHNKFAYIDAFADAAENINPDMPSATWELNFIENEGIATVSIKIKHKNLEALEQIIAMGFQAGFTMTLNYLDHLLNTTK